MGVGEPRESTFAYNRFKRYLDRCSQATTRIAVVSWDFSPVDAELLHRKDAELVLQAATPNTKPRTQLLSIKVLISV